MTLGTHVFETGRDAGDQKNFVSSYSLPLQSIALHLKLENIIVFQSLFASTGRQRSDSLQGIREQTDIHIS